MRRLFAIIVAVIAFIGCSMDDITVSYQTDNSDIYYASFEDFGEESRTYVDENVKLLWHEDDRISLFRTTLNEQFKFTGATGDNSGSFSAIPSDELVTGNEVSTIYAVYPYDATTKLSNDEIIQLTMPAVQHYAENSFGRGANTMVAASENTSSNFLPFRNLGGYIILKLYGEDTTIKSIEFNGNNEEVIAGAATAEAKYGYLPVIAMSESGTTTITLDCGEEGVTISSDSANPTSFWFVVPLSHLRAVSHLPSPISTAIHLPSRPPSRRPLFVTRLSRCLASSLPSRVRVKILRLRQSLQTMRFGTPMVAQPRQLCLMQLMFSVQISFLIPTMQIRSVG